MENVSLPSVTQCVCVCGYVCIFILNGFVEKDFTWPLKASFQNVGMHDMFMCVCSVQVCVYAYVGKCLLCYISQ